MSSFRFIRLLSVTVTAVMVASASALAEPPSRVARLSFIGGAVSFRPASVEEWRVAELNYPLTTGDHVWTDRHARAEVQVGSFVVRVAPYTEFSFVTLDDDMARLRVTQGAVSI